MEASSARSRAVWKRRSLSNDNGDGNENVISKYKLRDFNRLSKYFNLFNMTRCGSSSKMTLAGTALNLGEKMKIYSQVLTFFMKPQIWRFDVVIIIGSFSKDDGYGYGNATKQEYYWLKKEKCSCCACNTNFGAFLCRTPQNNNVKSPNFRF